MIRDSVLKVAPAELHEQFPAFKGVPREESRGKYLTKHS